jgi:hypothetical protein
MPTLGRGIGNRPLRPISIQLGIDCSLTMSNPNNDDEQGEENYIFKTYTVFLVWYKKITSKTTLT